jgi:LPS export ABC transporter protein LptC
MKRHRLATGILGVVGVFVLMVACTLIAKSRTAPVDSAGPAASSADLSIKEAKIEEDTGGVRWRLTADQVLIFDAEGRTALRNISVQVFERDRTWNIVGEEGDLFQATKNLEIRKNVVITSNDGLKLETSVLRWQAAEKRLWSDAPVRLSRDGATAEGTALDVRTADGAMTLTGRVRTTFNGGTP